MGRDVGNVRACHFEQSPCVPLTLIDDLQTPCLLVDRARLEQNLDRMQARADDAGVSLRPHAKTHKCPALAREQIDRGAMGLTVATCAEAESFVQSGVDDVRVAYPVVSSQKHERLAALMDRAQISFTVDTPDGVEQAAAFYEEAGRTVDVLIEIDVGHGRCGIPWDRPGEIVRLAERVASAASLRLTGILTHAGQAYRGPKDGETREAALRRVGREERDRMLGVAAALGEAGHADPETFTVSIGSTPSLTHFENAAQAGFRITEIRPGNYVFHDRTQVDLGAAALDDCALTVFTSVVSKRRDDSGTERVYVDAGKKVMTTDEGPGLDGYGTVLYNARYMRAHPHATIYALSEEHGWMRVPGGATFGVGDRLRVVPNHACVTVATQTELYVVDDDEVVDTWAVDAKGW